MPEQDAIALLIADHEKVSGLFEDFEKLGDGEGAAKETLVAQICEELTVHARIEEEVFYPRVRRAGEEEKDEVLEGVEEHKLIKDLVADLEGMSAAEESFGAKVHVLKEQVEHHVEEEESEMFPHAQKAIGKDELVSLGRQLAAAKEQATAE